VPTLVIAGPLLAQFMDRLVPIKASAVARDASGAPLSAGAGGGVGAELDRDAERSGAAEPAEESASVQSSAATNRGGLAGAVETPLPDGVTRRPHFVAAVSCMVLPVLLMLVKAIGDLTLDTSSSTGKLVDFIGTPAVALLAGVLLAMLALGRASGMDRGRVQESLGSGLPGVASIMLIVAAGGGFKTVLSDSGVANVIANYAHNSHMSALVLGWLVAVAVRLATGSATVATVTTAGIVGGVATSLDQPHLALLVLAIGAGSLFFSHVNDAGFWLVKEYFGLTVGQTLKSWSVMETVISVVAFVCVLILGAIV
jgi:gluconate:H+ symporter, GntP family